METAPFDPDMGSDIRQDALAELRNHADAEAASARTTAGRRALRGDPAHGRRPGAHRRGAAALAAGGADRHVGSGRMSTLRPSPSTAPPATPARSWRRSSPAAACR